MKGEREKGWKIILLLVIVLVDEEEYNDTQGLELFAALPLRRADAVLSGFWRLSALVLKSLENPSFLSCLRGSSCPRVVLCAGAM